MLENNPHLTSQEIAEEFGNPDTTVEDHINSLGFVLKKRSVWVLHELTEKEFEHHQQAVPKPNIHQRKVLLCFVEQERSSVLRVAETGKTINADLYCNQLDKLNAAIKVKRPALASERE
ncbi:mariner Mos1 transposase [Trichonephila clavipes]|nr:mariner Mos1 transposase [Trichonephila clavipes]